MKTTLLVFAEFCHVAWGSLPWPTLTNYGHAVSAYWWVLLAGMGVLFVDRLKWRGKETKVLVWLKNTVVISAFSLTQFLAYRDSTLDYERVRHERSDAIGERDELKSEVAGQQAKLEEKDNLIQAQQSLINRKIVSSLESQKGLLCLGPRVEMPRRASGQRAVTANRLLDDKRKNILVALLQSTPAVAEIQEPVNNDEAAGRGSELIEILGKAGWSFRRIKWIIPEGEAHTGIVIRSGANNLAMAAQLEKALSDVGVPARQEEQTESSDWIEVYVGPQAKSN
jgi:hypothetical protein